MIHVEEKIVEAYVKFVKKWFTMSNISCKNNKEIDILAIDLDGNRYHIEVKIHKNGWPIFVKEDGRKNIVTLEGMQSKFNDQDVQNKIKDIFGDNRKLKRILVYWKVCREYENRFDEFKRKANAYGIDDIWLMPNIMKEIAESEECKERCDDAVRIIKLFNDATIQ